MYRHRRQPRTIPVQFLVHEIRNDPLIRDTSIVMVPLQPTFADMFGSVCPVSHTALGIARLASVPPNPVTPVGARLLLCENTADGPVAPCDGAALVTIHHRGNVIDAPAHAKAPDKES
jgi:hypothetical protein